jgi:hypothetical protein
MCDADGVAPVAPTCADGFIYNTESNTCVEDPIVDPENPQAPQEATCSNGGTLNPDTDMCEVPAGESIPACPTGYHVDGGFCVADVVSEPEPTPEPKKSSSRRRGGGSIQTPPGVVLGASTGLTEDQIKAIIELLRSFGADENEVDNINKILRGQQVLGTSTGTAAGAGFVFTQTLQLGSSGQEVVELQKVLIAKGFLKIDAPTGYFGPITEAAVKAYQTAHGLPAVGIVGPLTRAALNAGN